MTCTKYTYTYDDIIAVIERECARCMLDAAETVEVVDTVLEKLCTANDITEQYVRKTTLNTIRSLKRKKKQILYTDLAEYENVVVEDDGTTLSEVLDTVLAELYAVLTPRQRKIFELTAHNYKVTEIAELLHLAPRSVVAERQQILHHIHELFRKYHIPVKRQRFRARKS